MSVTTFQESLIWNFVSFNKNDQPLISWSTYVSVQLFKCISGKNSRILLYFIGDERLWDNGLHGVPVLVCMLEIRKVVSDCLINFFRDKYNEWVTSRRSSVVMRMTNEIIFYFQSLRGLTCRPKSQRWKSKYYWIIFVNCPKRCFASD